MFWAATRPRSSVKWKRRSFWALASERFGGAAADSKSWALARPVEGFPAHYEKVADALRAAGVEIRCAAGLKSVRKVQDEFETGTAHGTFFAKRVINTLPLKTVIHLLGKPDAVEIAST
jgi:protoporphyrinogen oxidase